MECFICGSNDADFFKLEREEVIFKNIEKIIERLKGEGKVLRGRIKNGDNDSKFLGTELGKINKKVKELQQEKEKLTRNDFFGLVFFDIYMEEERFAKAEFLEKFVKYERKSLSEKGKIKICVNCNAICNSKLNKKYSE